MNPDLSQGHPIGITDREAVTFKIKLSSSIPSVKHLREVYHQYHFSSTFLSQDPNQYSAESNWQQLKKY